MVAIELCVSSVPVKDGLRTVLRATFQPTPADVGTVFAKVGVISQRPPGHRVMLFAYNEETTAAMQTAARKLIARRSYLVAMRRKSFRRQNIRSMALRLR